VKKYGICRLAHYALTDRVYSSALFHFSFFTFPFSMGSNGLS